MGLGAPGTYERLYMSRVVMLSQLKEKLYGTTGNGSSPTGAALATVSV